MQEACCCLFLRGPQCRSKDLYHVLRPGRFQRVLKDVKNEENEKRMNMKKETGNSARAKQKCIAVVLCVNSVRSAEPRKRELSVYFLHLKIFMKRCLRTLTYIINNSSYGSSPDSPYDLSAGSSYEQ